MCEMEVSSPASQRVWHKSPSYREGGGGGGGGVFVGVEVAAVAVAEMVVVVCGGVCGGGVVLERS
jgi:hypothetical protein